MNIILCGYGKMGKELEKALINHNVFIVSGESDTRFEEIKCDIDVIIDFSYPDMIFEINQYLLNHKIISLIIGTTGYNEEHMKMIDDISKTHKVIMFSNYSKGINIFFKLVELLSLYLENEKIYLFEKHHKEKKDIPSGTAISISEILNKEIQTISIREGEIKGEHQLDVYLPYETISIRHEAYSRKAFVDGVIHTLELLENIDIGLYTKRNFDIWKENKLLV